MQAEIVERRYSIVTPEPTKVEVTLGRSEAVDVASMILKNPVTALRNIIQPDADVAALKLQEHTGGQASKIWELLDRDGAPVGGFKFGNPVSSAADGLRGRFELNNTGTGHAPFGWVHGIHTFGAFKDPTMSLGYNNNGDGGPIVAGEPINHIQWEADYWDGTDRILELFTEFANNAGTITSFRTIYMGLRRAATTKESFVKFFNLLAPNVQIFNPKDAGNSLIYNFLAGELEIYGDPAGPGPNNASLTLRPSIAAGASLLNMGFGGTANTFQLQTDSTTQTRLIAGGFSAAVFYKLTGGAAASIGGFENTAALTVINGTAVISSPVLVVRGMTGQTGNLIEIKNPAGVTQAWFAADARAVIPNMNVNFYQDINAAKGYLDTSVANINFLLMNRVIGNVPLAIRAIASQTANFFEWQDSAGAILGKIQADGRAVITNMNVTFYQDINASKGYFDTSVANINFLLMNRVTSNVPLAIRAIASQSVDMLQLQNSAGTVLTRVTLAGFIGIGVAATEPIHIVTTGDRRIQMTADSVIGYLRINGTGGSVAFGPQTVHPLFIVTSDVARIQVASDGRLGFNSSAVASVQGIIIPGATTTVGWVVRAIASQSADLFQTQDSAGAVLSKINKAGYIITKKVAAPADGDLASSEGTWWLDDTVGATKIMFKAKDSGGTVRTGNIALA